MEGRSDTDIRPRDVSEIQEIGISISISDPENNQLHIVFFTEMRRVENYICFISHSTIN
jgi:hypothetical protein